MLNRALLFVFISLLLLAGCTSSGSHSPISNNDIIKDSSSAISLIDSAMNYVLKPGSEKADIDSALLLLRMADSLNRKLDNIFIAGQIDFTYSNAYREGGDTSSGHSYIKKAVELLKKSGNHGALGNAYMESSSYFNIVTNEQMAQKKDFFNLAWLEFEQTDLKIRQGDALKNLADMESVMSLFPSAIAHLLHALTIYNAAGHKDLQGVYDLLNSCYRTIGDGPNGLKYGLLALQTAELRKDTTMQLCAIYNRLGMAYINVQKPQQFYFYIKKAIALALKFNDANAVYTLLCNYSRNILSYNSAEEAIRMTNELLTKIKPKNYQDSSNINISYALALVTLKRYSEAEVYAQRVISLYNRLKELNDENLINFLMSYHFKAHKFDQLKKYCLIGFNMFKKQQFNLPWKSMLYRYSARADSGLGNYRSALDNFQKYKMAIDSLRSQSMKYKVEQLQIEFETTKKDADIKIKQQNIQLLTNKSRLQESDLKRSNTIRNITIITSIFFIGLLFIGFRIKQRHNEKLQSQQQEINHQNELLKLSLSKQQKLTEDKEWLIKEIHHRVKNNLQIVISLFNAQSEFLSDPSALQAIQESRERMHAIALIHQKLYEPGAEGGLIDILSYIQEMTNYFSANMTNEKIKFQISVQDTILDVSQAVPVGLILNEVITNSIKYAFPTGQSGVINIFLKEENNWVFLTIADNGIGLPSQFNIAQQTSLGIQLIKLFSDQLEGDLHIFNENGVKVTLSFKKQLLPDILSINLNSTV